MPPDTGIVHQVNLEYLARVVFRATSEPGRQAYPDTLVGTDSHTTMINGLGVLGWGVGGIEAEAAMLGQPMSMLIPQVVGFKLSGELPEGATATDLVLTVTEMLREHGVVGKFVEFYGPGLASLPLADRATIGNMSPEFGSTCAIFPIDAETLRYLEFSGRPPEQIELVEAYAQGAGPVARRATARSRRTPSTLELDLGDVVPSLAGPKRPQDRVPLTEAKDVVPRRARGLPRPRPSSDPRFEPPSTRTPASPSPSRPRDPPRPPSRPTATARATATPSRRDGGTGGAQVAGAHAVLPRR